MHTYICMYVHIHTAEQRSRFVSEPRRQLWLGVHDLALELLGLLVVPGGLPRHHLVEQDPKRPDVHLRRFTNGVA